MLGKLNDIDSSKAMPRIKAVFSRAESTDVALATFANKLLIRDLDSFDSAEAKAHLEANKKLITTTSNKELIKGCIFALSEFKSADAVEMLFDNVNFEEAKGMQYFARNNFDKVSEYLETADFSELKRIVEAAPIEDFKPILEKQLAARSADAAQAEEINSLITLVDTADDESNARYATGYQGFIAYRDGVFDIPYFPPRGEWHAAIIINPEIGYDNDQFQYIHIGGPFQNGVNMADHSDFMDKQDNIFMGIYGKNTGTRTREDIMNVAWSLLPEDIGYTVVQPLTYKLGHSGEIEPQHINNLRCDGVTEYSYEARGVRILGTDKFWDISQTSGANTHVGATVFTPSKQAKALVRKDG